jgi:hypothetical protein
VVSLQSIQKRADCETGSWKIQRSFSLWRVTHCWNLELRNRKLKLHHQQRMHNQALSEILQRVPRGLFWIGLAVKVRIATEGFLLHLNH